MNSFYARLLCIILWLSEQLFPIAKCPESRVGAIFSQIQFGGIKIQGDFRAMELREGQQVTVTASLKTAAGHDADYQTGSATWESSDPAASVTANPDNELEATVIGVDGSTNATAVITFRADGDPDADQTRDLVGTLDVAVTKGEAAVVELSAGAPSDVPTA